MKIRNIDVDQEDVKRIACFSDFVLDTINTAFKYEVAKLDKKDLISSERFQPPIYPIVPFTSLQISTIVI